MATTFLGCCSTFRTLGTAATPHNLFTFQNTAGSAVIASIKSLVVQLDATAALTAVMPQIKTSRLGAAPTGGTTLVKVPLDTNLTSASNIILSGATASDGGVATAITATAADTIWQQYGFRLHTAVGQVLALDNPVLPVICDTYPLILRAGQFLLVQIVATAGTSNPATNHWFASCMWEEYTE